MDVFLCISKVYIKIQQLSPFDYVSYFLNYIITSLPAKSTRKAFSRHLPTDNWFRPEALHETFREGLTWPCPHLGIMSLTHLPCFEGQQKSGWLILRIILGTMIVKPTLHL